MKSLRASIIAASALIFLCLLFDARISAGPPRNATRSVTRTQKSAKEDAHDFAVILEGTVGKHAVQMALTRHAEDLTGSYFYENVGIDIDVTGKVDSTNRVTIQETDADGKQTGLFKGRLDSHVTNGETLLQLSGTWSKPDGSGASTFSLDQQHFDLGAGARIVSKKIEKESEKPKYSIDVEYPQIEGGSSGAAGFNREVESLAAKEVAEFKKDSAGADAEPSDNGSDLGIGYELTFASPRLVSIILGISNYSAGAAHPANYSQSITYDLVSGKSLILANLFKPGSPYLQTVSRICIAQLNKKLGTDSDADWINKGAAAKASNYKVWNVTSRSLVITFDPYQVASYAAGDQTVRIPYTAIKDILDPNGPIASLVK